MPDELSGYRKLGERDARVRRLWIRGASFHHGVHVHLQALSESLGVAEIQPIGTFSAPEFFRMLAKIAHAFAVAELGLDSFTPYLIPIIVEGDTSNCAQYIGGLQYEEPLGAELHELSFDSHTCDKPEIVSVKIRLLAPLQTPTYYVAVGRSKLTTTSAGGTA